MPDAKTKRDLHYRPVKRHLRESEGCCETCDKRVLAHIYRIGGELIGDEHRCAPIVGGGSANSRKHRLRPDHVCDAYKRKERA